MATDNVGAYQEMCAAVRACVLSPAMSAIVGYTPELRYGDVNYPKVPEPDKLWCKLTVAAAEEKTRTVGMPCRITYTGVAGIQLFVPVTDKQAAERIRRVADLLKSALLVNTNNVNFYKAGHKAQPADPPWNYTRVFATFEYSEWQGK